MELYGRVPGAVYVEALSRRETARRFGIDPRTVAKMLAFSVPPGYRRGRPDTLRSRRPAPSCCSRSSASATSAAQSSSPATCPSTSGPACSSPND